MYENISIPPGQDASPTQVTPQLLLMLIFMIKIALLKDTSFAIDQARIRTNIP